MSNQGASPSIESFKCLCLLKYKYVYIHIHTHVQIYEVVNK